MSSFSLLRNVHTRKTYILFIFLAKSRYRITVSNRKIDTHKMSALAALFTLHLPPKTKNFPHDPATKQSETNFRFVNGGGVGEVLGGSGRFGG